MAAKRITQTAINWTALGDRVPVTQKANFMAFKMKSDSYLKRVLANPEKPPAIDWSVYKARITIPGMVDEFEKSYKALSIPYPPDNYTKLVDEQEKQVQEEILKFKAESNKNIEKYEHELAGLQALIPFDQMTMEDFADAYPDQALDPLKKPTYWPHDAEEQVDYRDKGHPLYGTNPHGEH